MAYYSTLFYTPPCQIDYWNSLQIMYVRIKDLPTNYTQQLRTLVLEILM